MAGAQWPRIETSGWTVRLAPRLSHLLNRDNRAVRGVP